MGRSAKRSEELETQVTRRRARRASPQLTHQEEVEFSLFWGQLEFLKKQIPEEAWNDFWIFAEIMQAGMACPQCREGPSLRERLSKAGLELPGLQEEVFPPDRSVVLLRRFLNVVLRLLKRLRPLRTGTSANQERNDFLADQVEQGASYREAAIRAFKHNRAWGKNNKPLTPDAVRHAVEDYL